MKFFKATLYPMTALVLLAALFVLLGIYYSLVEIRALQIYDELINSISTSEQDFSQQP